MDADLVYGDFHVSKKTIDALNTNVSSTTSLLGLYAIIELSKLATVSAFSEYERLCTPNNNNTRHLMCYIDIEWFRKHW